MLLQEQLQRFPGEVNLLFSEQELDDIIKEEASSLVVLMSTVTWCRPCKGMQKAIQVRELGCTQQSNSHYFVV